MTWTIEGLRKEYLDSRAKTSEAWIAFYFVRAEPPIFAAYKVISISYQQRVAKNNFPKEPFLSQFKEIRQKLIDEAYRLPEFEEYQRCRDEEKEHRLVWIDAKMRFGGERVD